MTTKTTGGSDESFAVALEQLPVHAGLVVVALEKREAAELNQVAVPLVGLGQQREVVVLLLAAFGLAARVVDSTSASGSLGAGLIGHVGLGADNRFHALLLALAIEVEHAVHVAVIGHTQRGLAIGSCLGHEFVETSGTVEHRELGMHMKMRK